MCTSKILTHLCFIKQKKWFCKSCLQCFSSKNIMIKHKEDCLSINGTQSVDVEEGIIKFENYSKQLPVPFKIYADFECNLLKFMKALAQENIMIMSLVVMRQAQICLCIFFFICLRVNLHKKA